MKILILGVNGFIGHHLSRRILGQTDWTVYGMDMTDDRLGCERTHERFHFFEGDITINKEWIEYHIKKCDLIVPLVAIATPSIYVRDPLRVFELDFEANLPIVRAACRYGKRLIFPSTSEVYGMSGDCEFNPETSPLVYGPISKTRWIYACAKQMMDRVIHAYGQQHGLQFTLFRPFNWIGPNLDTLESTSEGSSRVVSQFFGALLRGEALQLVGGGHQRRCFTAIDDGLDALMRIIINPGGVADGKIYNIGNPANDLSIAELAELMIAVAYEFPEMQKNLACVSTLDVDQESFYGAGYQDATHRVPNIDATTNDLGWVPSIDITTGLREIFGDYLKSSVS